MANENRWPADEEEERLALGACWRGQAEDATRLLRPEDFSLSTHREIFAAICSLVQRGEKELEFPIVAAELQRRGRLNQCGGIAYLSDLADRCNVKRPMEHRVRRLRELAERRRLAKLAEKLSLKAVDVSQDVDATKNWIMQQGGDRNE